MTGGLVVFIEPAIDQLGNRLDGLARLASGRLHQNGRAGPGRQHHQTHDRGAPNGDPIPGDGDFGVEMIGSSNEPRRGARVQPPTIADGQSLAHCTVGLKRRLVHLPNTSLATLIYFRPASAAMRTASRISKSDRMRASLTSMGRLSPARTSILRSCIT